MKKPTLIAIFFLLFIAIAFSSTTVELGPPSEDVHIRAVKGPNLKDSHAYMKFDISSIPPGKTIEDVRLSVWISVDNGDGDANFSNVNDQGWTESNTTAEIWAIPISNETIMSSGFSGVGVWVNSSNISDIFNKDYVEGNQNLTIRVSDLDEPAFPDNLYNDANLHIGSVKDGSSTIFNSSEGANTPKLWVTYAVAEVTYCTGSAYDPPGNWTITTDTVCHYENIPVDGNITITSTGSLLLNHSNITFNVTANGSFIFVNGGKLYSRNSTITTNDSNYYIKFNITVPDLDDVVDLNETRISYVGWGATDNFRIYNSKNVTIKNTNTSRLWGLSVEGSENIRIINSNLTAFGPSYGIQLSDVKDITVSGSLINATDGDGIYGPSLKWMNDTTIYDNVIRAASDEKGIYSLQSGPRNNVTGNDIESGQQGIYMRYGSHISTNLTISYNKIRVTAAGSFEGIYFEYQSNATVFKNNITSVDYYGIHPHDSGDVNITGNIVNTSNSYALSVTGGNAGKNNEIFYNNFTGGGGAAYIGPTRGYHTFYKNNFTASGGGVALYLWSERVNNFTENNITSTASAVAINITNSNSTVFYNNYISSSTGNGITSFEKSNNNSFTNDDITSGTGANDIWFNNSGDANFTNVSFAKTKVGFNIGSTAKLYVNWYVQGYVNDTAGSPIADANFSAWNVTNGFQWWNWTDSNGYTDWMTIQELIQNATANSSQQNTTFNATKTGYQTGEVSLNATVSMQVNITLTAALVDTSFSLTLPVCSGNFSNSSETYPGNPTKYLNFTYNTSGCFGGNCPNVNPCVEGVACCQNSTEPIYVFTNLGNVNLDWYINVTYALPSWITMFWNNTNYEPTTVQTISAGVETLINSSIPVNTNATLWLWVNFTNAPAGEAWSNITSKANQSA